MNKPDFSDLDSFIEEALRGEALRPAPVGLRRRVDEKIRVLVLLDKERKRFRSILAWAAFLVAALLSTGAGVAWVGEMPQRILSGIPGGMGLYDRGAAYLAQWWPGLVGAAAFAICLIGLGSFLVETRAMRKGLPAE